MSYVEFARIANRFRYIPYDELMFGDRTKHMDNTQDDQIFESSVFGAKSTHKKDPSVKGGENNKK